MKIAFVAQPIDSVIPPNQNSIGIIIYEMAYRLAKDHDVTVYLKGGGIRKVKRTLKNITFKFLPIGPDMWAQRFLGRFINSHTATKPYYASWLYFISYALQIAVDARHNQYDILHVVNFTQFIPIIRLLNPNLKIVIHMECEWLNQLDYRMIRERVMKADLILGCSNHIEKRVTERYPDLGNNCFTLYNGVDVEGFKPTQNERRKADNQKVLFVGRISPEKGIHVLITAFIKAARINPNLHLELIGPVGSAPGEYIIDISDDPIVRRLEKYFDEDYEEILKNLIPMQLKSKVHFYDKVPYRELVQKYCEATVFVFPSVWEEPFGMPVIEAMACGIPVIATKSGGISELIEDQNSGILVERDDPNELADALTRLASDTTLNEKLGVAGRMRVMQRFTWDKITEELTCFYNKILQRV